MWTLTQGWRSVGSGKANEPYDSEEPIGPSEVLSPADQEYSTVDKEPKSISEDSSHTPDEHSGVVKRTTFELAVSRVIYALQMRRITEFLSRPTGIRLESQLWLLGVSYGESLEAEGGDAAALKQFQLDFESRLWFTYRSDYAPLGTSKLQSDVGWGCMLRSGQMMLAQALVNNRLGRSWRKKSDEVDPAYLAILQTFSDNAQAPFSIHNIIAVGGRHGLVSGAWIGPSVLCRTLESLSHPTCAASKTLGMAVCVVAGNEEGGGGGAPVLCIDDVARLCSGNESSASGGEGTGGGWKAVLIVVPLMLGLEKVNERYLPSLQATFTFPQSVGMLGGKPGGATYIVGSLNNEFIYLDPHQLQQMVPISSESALADTSSYHCRVVRKMAVEVVDPSLALGFYCHTRDDFEDLCARVSDLAEKSGGAPMFTVGVRGASRDGEVNALKQVNDMERGGGGDEDWQLV